MKDRLFVVACSTICLAALTVSILNFSSLKKASSSGNRISSAEGSAVYDYGVETSDDNMIDVDNMTPTTVEISPKAIDLGEISQDSVRTVHFVLKNTGEEALYLQSLKSGCLCTRSEYDRNFAMPGDSIMITLTFNPEGKPGKQTIYSVVRINSLQKDHKLTLKATVRNR